MKVAAWLPMQAWDDLSFEQTRRIGDFARRAEDLGFAGLWTYDHLIKGSGLYSVGWLEPMSVMSYVAGCTSTIDIGSAVLVLPVRHPVVLAKEIATLQYLAAGRFILGAGAGWNPKEFDAVQMRLTERGSRTDEGLEIVTRLLAGERLTMHGRHHQLTDVRIEPTPPGRQRVWYGGGSKPNADGSVTEIHPSVLRRIVHADGWLSRGAAPLELLVHDWEVIQVASAAAERTPPVFAHCNYLHLVESPDEEVVEAEQLRAYRRILGPEATPAEIAETHFLGTIDQTLEDIARYERAGVQYLILGVLDYLPEQLDLWARHILPAVDGDRT